MPLPIEYNLYRTKDSYEFEDIVCDVCIKKFERDFQRFGRLGQYQFGIDVISDAQGELICVQCKNYTISPKEIDDIINKALQFTQPMSKFIIATNSSRDVKLQEKVIKENNRRDLNFEVCIMFWDEISSIISQDEKLLSKYYPKTNKDSIEWLVSEFNQLIYKYDILGYVNVDPVIGMPKYYPGWVDSFVFEIGKNLIQVNTLQEHPKFIAINSFRDTINSYNGYLAIKLFPASNMYTIQNPYDRIDVSKKESEIRNNIYNYKKEMDKLYGQINEKCSMFSVIQYL